jgi:hypothetical protein
VFVTSVESPSDVVKMSRQFAADAGSARVRRCGTGSKADTTEVVGFAMRSRTSVVSALERT